MTPSNSEIWTYEGQKQRGLRVFVVYSIRSDGYFSGKRTPFAKESKRVKYEEVSYLKEDRLKERLAPKELGEW
jgi:hypothetical protein